MEMYLILCGVIVFLMAIIVFQQLTASKQIEKLTNKILAETYRDYAFSNLEYERELTKRKQPKKDNKIHAMKV